MEMATTNQDINSGIASDNWKNEWENKQNDPDIEDQNDPLEESYTELENEILKQMNLSTH
jgi:hypothetical protein